MGCGCSCCCGNSNHEKAFKSDLGAPLLKDVVPLMGVAHVVICRVVSARGLSAATYGGVSDPYVELRLQKAEAVAGEQMQCTSKRPETVDPTWEPPERFQFIVNDPDKAKLILSVYHDMGGAPGKPLGDGTMLLKDLDGTPKTKAIRLINPANGKMEGGEVEISLSRISPDEASKLEEHTVFEYQRYTVGTWVDTLLPTDPGRWVNAIGTEYANNLEEIEPPIPRGWIVSKPWSFLSTVAEVEGWQYGSEFHSVDWYPNVRGGCYYRRRSWLRVIESPDYVSTNQRRPSGVTKRVSALRLVNKRQSITAAASGSGSESDARSRSSSINRPGGYVPPPNITVSKDKDKDGRDKRLSNLFQ